MRFKEMTCTGTILKRAAALSILAILLLPLGLAIAGCGDSGGPESYVQFPDFVYRSEDALKGYQMAVANRDILHNVPCYCGCGRDAEKYQDLEDCFFNRNTGDYDEHAAGCATCLDEAKDISQWQKDGKSVKEIRDQIDSKYGERGEPTHTPPVAV
ncbi:MAG: hypothetical protein JJD96_02325 [Thermoleophilia bacterium]|nr:hypothetical protein [Thermoleophilia bacterium]